ncbi:hypothetical protein FISHEDRAFT_67724 [Fistulina hepatica ATCC 64428]|nr:hypothetical protein FISHEDRAFT_67724 [Fistulina hepatica ATCC 64428]
MTADLISACSGGGSTLESAGCLVGTGGADVVVGDSSGASIFVDVVVEFGESSMVARAFISLSAHYLPAKFSQALLSPAGPRQRKKNVATALPKRGGGVEAFRTGEARIPGVRDEDYDGVMNPQIRARQPRWNRFKWTLFVTNILLTIYSMVALVFCLLTWFNAWTHADIIRVGNAPELVFSTIAAALGLFVAMIGWAGILLNNRGFLAWYTFLLWICFAFLVVPGYITYKKRAFNLEGKVGAQWSRHLGMAGRLRIQNELLCCGWFSPFTEASISQTCYSRSVLPGCKRDYLHFERKILTRWYTVAFCLVPLQIAVMVSALLCSNHVTYRFGKGMMPKKYRLNADTMAVIMDNYANELAEQYGAELAKDVMAKTRRSVSPNESSSTLAPFGVRQ